MPICVQWLLSPQLNSASVQVPPLSLVFPGPWPAHSHCHQLIHSTFTVSGRHLFVGDSAGDLRRLDCDHKEEDVLRKIQDGPVLELELWLHHQLLVVAGAERIHFYTLDTLERVTEASEVRQGSNKHLSAFGAQLAYGLPDCLTVRVLEDEMVEGKIGVVPVQDIALEAEALLWELWEDMLLVLLAGGQILVYRRLGGEAQLLTVTQPNMMIMYRNPCFLFRSKLAMIPDPSDRLFPGMSSSAPPSHRPRGSPVPATGW